MIRRLAGGAGLVFLTSCQSAPPPSFSFARELDKAEAEFDPLGGREARVASQLDIFSTILEAAGLPKPHKKERGASAVTEITWEGQELRGPAMKVAVRKGPLKYVATFEGDVNDPEFVSRLVREALYDLSLDRGEKNDVFAQRDQKDVESFRTQVRSFLKDVRSRRASGSAGAIALDEKMREKLRALGYLDP